MNVLKHADPKKGWDLHDLQAADWLRPPEGLLGGHLLVPGTVCVMAGPPGSGKTWLAYKLADCIVSGKHFADLETEQSRVLFVSEEMSPSEMRERVLGFNHSGKFGLRFRFQQGIDCQRWDGVTKLRELIREEGCPGLVIYDTFRDLHSGPESSNDYVGTLMKGLVRVCRETGTCLLLLHHYAKLTQFNEDGLMAMRGASVIRATAANIFLVERDDRGRHFKFGKVRHMAEPEGFDFLIQDVGGKTDVVFLRNGAGVGPKTPEDDDVPF